MDTLKKSGQKTTLCSLLQSPGKLLLVSLSPGRWASTCCTYSWPHTFTQQWGNGGKWEVPPAGLFSYSHKPHWTRRPEATKSAPWSEHPWWNVIAPYLQNNIFLWLHLNKVTSKINILKKKNLYLSKIKKKTLWCHKRVVMAIGKES